MAKDDLSDVKEIVETTSTNPEETAGKLTVNLEYFRANLDTFNETYGTSFTSTTPTHEVQAYFTTYYVELIQKLMYKKTNPQKAFNNHFKDYAKIQ